MFYEHMNIIMFKVLGLVINNILDKLIYIDYMYFHQDKVLKHDMNLRNTIFDYFSGIRIPNVLKNLLSCCGISMEQHFTVILTCQITLVSYHL